MIDLRLGDWHEVLADVDAVDVMIVDPPYGVRTHRAHERQGPRYDDFEYHTIPYDHWEPDHVIEFVNSWVPRVRGWFVAMTSHDLFPVYEKALEALNRYVFQPVPCVMPGMNVRLGGDGPSSWAVYAVVARPRNLEFSNWGTLPGAYICRQRRERGIVGGKPIDLMRAFVRDYSREGDLICDPCAGLATTAIAAEGMGRDFVGAEVTPSTHEKALKRIARGVQREMFA